MTARGNLDAATQLLALAGDRELADPYRAVQVAEAQARALVAIARYLSLAIDLGTTAVGAALGEDVAGDVVERNEQRS